MATNITRRRKIIDSRVSVSFTPDEILFKEIPKVFNMDKKDLGFILSIYLAMKGLRTGALAHSFKKQNVIEAFFANSQSLYPVNYRIYPDREPYQNMFKIFISTNNVPDNLVTSSGYMNHIELGKFLGYPCPRNISDPKADHVKKINYLINLYLEGCEDSTKQKHKLGKTKKVNSKIQTHQIYNFVCIDDDTNTIEIQEQLKALCAKITKYCRSRFPNLLPGLRVNFELKEFIMFPSN